MFSVYKVGNASVSLRGEDVQLMRLGENQATPTSSTGSGKHPLAATN